MVVQHNLQAMNSNRMLNITQSSLSKSTEKLSSGYRINRAADDAAGLAISEKMRKQIKGLTQASSNAQDGISCVQTAEGALAEVEDMLQRMNQLAVQAANGTNSQTDRQNIQDEIDQLVTEIDRVAETTKFNETYLLKGSTDGGTQALGQYTYKEFQVADSGNDWNTTNAASYYTSEDGTTLASSVSLSDYVELKDDGTAVLKRDLFIQAIDAAGDTYYTKVEAGSVVDELVDVVYERSDGTTFAETAAPTTGINLSATAVQQYFIQNDDGSRKYITDGNIEDYMEFAADGSVTFKSDVDIMTEVNGSVTLATVAASIGVVAKGAPMLYDADGNRISENGLAEIMKSDSARSKLYLKTGQSLEEIGIDDQELRSYIHVAQAEYADELNLTFHVGSEGAQDNKIQIGIDSMNSVQLGVDILSSGKNGIVDDDGQAATDAIKVIADAINKVSAQRSELGAIQNRLEHTINNLDNVVENTTSAESAIRDTDMASEMVAYSNQNILAQAGQSMLAQANQANQGVLSLLG
ncbi:MAG: flagellar hook protein [Lachnospiraceae bacterium]|nr:flagellar hook protein [Lachnospiraceae bacterium]